MGLRLRMERVLDFDFCLLVVTTTSSRPCILWLRYFLSFFSSFFRSSPDTTSSSYCFCMDSFCSFWNCLAILFSTYLTLPSKCFCSSSISLIFSFYFPAISVFCFLSSQPYLLLSSSLLIRCSWSSSLSIYLLILSQFWKVWLCCVVRS